MLRLQGSTETTVWPPNKQHWQEKLPLAARNLQQGQTHTGNPTADGQPGKDGEVEIGQDSRTEREEEATYMSSYTSYMQMI